MSDDKKIQELLQRGIELGRQRKELAVQVQQIKSELLKHGAGTAARENNVHSMAAAFIGACW